MAVIVLAASLAACSAPTATVAPTVDLQPTLNAVQTQAAQTVIANVTKNAPPTATPVTPTNTPAATSTPVPTATLASTNTLVPTATITYAPWTLTPSPAPYSCAITSASPAAGASISVGGSYDGNWVIKNTGTQTWLHKETDIRFLSGTNMQKAALTAIDMTADVTPGSSYTVLIDMLAPATASTYSATWVVITGKNTICTLTYTMIVK
jgi:hypothetical protein